MKIFRRKRADEEEKLKRAIDMQRQAAQREIETKALEIYRYAYSADKCSEIADLALEVCALSHKVRSLRITKDGGR